MTATSAFATLGATVGGIRGCVPCIIHHPRLPNSYRLPDRHIIAGEYPGSLDPEEARDKIRHLLDAGVTCFINLTTGRRQLRAQDPLTIRPYNAAIIARAPTRIDASSAT